MLKKYRQILFILAAFSVFLAVPIITSVSYAQEKYITDKDAAKHVGEVLTVCGTVFSAEYATEINRHPTFLYFDQPFPNQIFTIVIWGADRAKFPHPPESFYQGKIVCVRGRIRIRSFRSKPEIIVNDPSQITILFSQ